MCDGQSAQREELCVCAARAEEVVVFGYSMITVQSMLRAAWGGVNCQLQAESLLRLLLLFLSITEHLTILQIVSPVYHGKNMLQRVHLIST